MPLQAISTEETTSKNAEDEANKIEEDGRTLVTNMEKLIAKYKNNTDAQVADMKVRARKLQTASGVADAKLPNEEVCSQQPQLVSSIQSLPSN